MPFDEESIVVDIGDITPNSGNVKNLPAKLKLMQARVSHFISSVLVVSLCASIILYAICLGRYPEQSDVINTAFEKWYAVISPFAGLALGAYYGSSRARKLEDGI